jgi:hypothetical protein
MGDVLKKPTRAQLASFVKDPQALKAMETLFAASNSLVPGDVIYTGASSRSGALLANGAAVSRQLYPNLYSAIVPSGIVTITIASPGVVTWASHGLSANTPVYFVTNGALPNGITPGVEYFVKSVPTSDTFTISATSGGTVINTSGSQNGTQTSTAYPFGIGDGATTFNLPTVSAVGGCNAFIIY